MTFMSHRNRFALVVLLAPIWACGGSGPLAGSATEVEPTGEVSLAVMVVPPGVQCIQVTALGSTTVSQNFSVTPDAGTVGTLALGPLPIGSVAIAGQAFNVACASVAGASPTWVADKQTVTIQEGLVLPVTITFRPNNSVTATANFIGNVVEVAVGQQSIAVVLSDGTVRATGFIQGLTFGGTSFANVSALSNVAQLALSTSARFGCALLKTGTVECWGDNTYGELGTGGTADAGSGPVFPVSGLTNVVQIAAGYEHACALKSNGTVWCWGYNGYGQIGNGTTTNALLPVEIVYSGTTVALAGVSNIATGDYHTCAVAAGIVSCWGSNEYGQIGNNSTTNATWFTSVPTSELNGLTTVAAGSEHTCALRGDGSVFCWGNNNYGQLGDGTTTQSLVPVQSSLSNVAQIALTANSACARGNDGTVICFGYDPDGEVGDGTGAPSVQSPMLINLPMSTSISGAYADFCSMGTDLSIVCWGGNSGGQLGNGTTDPAFVPTPLTL